MNKNRTHKRLKLPSKSHFLIIILLGLLFILGTTFAMANENNYTVTASVLNVRVGPGMSYDVIDQTTDGTTLNVIEESNGWYKVRLDNDSIGWVASWYVDYNEPSTYENTVATVSSPQANIRQFNNTDSDILGTVTEGTELEILYQENGWTQVQYLGGLGWIYDELITSSAGNPDSVFTSDRIPISESTIVLDAGHGGDDPGAITTNNLYEKNIALETTTRLAQRLQDAGANVVLTRSGDATVSLEDRSYISMNHEADVFISIHYDSSDVHNSLSGTSTYYYSTTDQPLAETINAHLMQNSLLANNGVKFGNFYVLRENTQPSVLLELGYLNNDYDTSVVFTESYQNEVVELIYQALLDYFG